MGVVSRMDLNTLLLHAIELGASDVHLKVGQPPILRHDGDLSPMDGIATLEENHLEGILDIVTRSNPARRSHFDETGDLDISYSISGRRFRVNGFRQRGSISFAFRIIPADVPSFEQLGLPGGVARLANEHRGLVLVTGATGSGKTTTLAAMLDHINRSRHQHIVTIQDPDVILIGELRDTETALTAIQAAESGHLVFATLHTVDAAETLGRMIEFFPAEKQQQIRSILAGVLRGVISQRLLPAVAGGRVAAVEVMVTNARVADLIREARSDEIEDAIAAGEFYEMQTFMQALIELVLAGRVDEETAANAATNRHDFLVALDSAKKNRAAEEREAAQAARSEASENGSGPAPEPLGVSLR